MILQRDHYSNREFDETLSWRQEHFIIRDSGVSTKDLLETYTLFIRSRAEYVSVAFHSSLTKKQEKAIERIQSTCFKVILGDDYNNYDDALKRSGLKILKQRGEEKNPCI